jgi:hypothetical protein
MTTRLRALRPERAFLHPLWLASLALLLLNDRLLKGSGILPSALTGKLSDLCGMVVAPAVLAAVLAVRTRGGLVLAHAAVGIVFAAIKISPFAASLLETTMTSLGWSWRIWVDPTDLVALPVLALGYRTLLPIMEQPLATVARLRQSAQLAGAATGLLACLGTSATPPPVEAPPPPPAEVVVAEPPLAVGLQDLAGSRWRHDAGDGKYLAYRFDADRYTTSAYPPSEESGRIELAEAEGRTMKLRFLDRTFEGQLEEPMVRRVDLASDGQSFVMDGRTFVREGATATVATE